MNLSEQITILLTRIFQATFLKRQNPYLSLIFLFFIFFTKHFRKATMKSSLIAVFLLALNVLVLAEQPYWMHYMGNDEPKKVLKEQQVIAYDYQSLFSFLFFLTFLKLVTYLILGTGVMLMV